MRFIVRLCCCLLLALLVPAKLCAIKRLNFTNYRTEQGLSSNFVSNLTIDSDGFLWVATDYGLNRFDGAVFRTYLTDNYKSLLRNDVLKTIASGNEIIVSGYNGFFQFYNPEVDSFQSYFPETFVETIGRLFYGYGKKDVYALASDGLYVKRGNDKEFCKYNLPNVENIESVKAIMCDVLNHYWLVYPDKLSIYTKEGRCLQSFKFSPEQRLIPLPQLIDLHTGRVMAYLQDKKLSFYRLLPSGEIVFEYDVNLPFSNLCDIKVASDGSYWFASDGEGLWMSPSTPVSDAFFVRVLPYGSEPDELAKIYAIETDNNGNVWVGTQNTGLWQCSVLNKSSFFSSSDLGLPRCLGNYFCELSSGNMLVACDGLGICELSEKEGLKNIYTQKSGLDNLNLTALAVDTNGSVLVSAWGGGLFVGNKKGDNLHFTKKNNMVPECRTTMSNVVRLPDGSVWVCVGGEGMYVRENNAWKRLLLNYPDDWNSRELWPNFSFLGENNELWISTSFAMWTNRNGKLQPFGMELFMNNSSYIVNDGVGVPGFGVVLATRSGLLVAKTGDKTFSVLDLCPKKEVQSVVLDKKGKLWATVANSIWCFDLKQNTAKRFPKDFDALGKNFFLKHSKFCSSSGRIYFGTKEGFFSFNPELASDSSALPSLFLSRLEIDGEYVGMSPVRFTEGKQNEVYTVNLPYGHSSFAVCVDMPDFSHYRRSLVYRIKGEEWNSLNSDQRIAFSYLPVGSYQLEVKTLDVDDSASVKLKIVVEGPWWASWWFRCLAVVFVLLLLGRKIYRMNNDKKVLQQMVDERTNELKQKSLLVEKRNQELNNALITKDRLMAVVAHDLKNPVFAIVGALEGLRRKNNQLAAEERASALDSMIGRAQTLQTELSKLLVWATSNQGEVEFRPSNVDLSEIINSDLSLLQMQAESKSVALEKNVNLPNYSYVDGRMVSTAIRNVLGNSIKFTESGKKITIRAWQEGDLSIVEVEDQGVGISADKIKELLNKTVNTSSNGTMGETGTGLGVGLAKYYVDANGGRFLMSSTLGVGTITRMEFPATQIKVVQQHIAQTSEKLSFVVDAELLEGNCVLVVDDDPLISENVSSMLEGYVEVLLASNGAEALKVVKEKNVDIVISDVEMPVMNGIDMSNALASDESTNHIPVLFLSAKTTESDRLLGLLTGAVDYIPKPFSQSELLIKLNNILTLRQRQQQRLLREQVETDDVAVTAGVVEEQESTTTAEKVNPFLQQVLEDIKLHYADAGYSVEQMASNLFTTRITLYRKVKSLSGQNPSEWLIEFRLNKAHQMLKDGSVALQDVAFAVGFSDHTYFARRFKARFGFAPKEVK